MNNRLLFIPVIIVAAIVFLVFCFAYTFVSGWDFNGSSSSALRGKIVSSSLDIPETAKDFSTAEVMQEKALTPTPSPEPTATPTPAKEKRIVVIDAGHGGVDAGTQDNGVVEKEVTLNIALKLETLLKQCDVDTYMIRTTDVYMDHKERIQKANEIKAALFLSIHCDWFSDPSLHGTQTLYLPSKTLAAGNLTELDYANLVQSELIKKLKTNNRGINARPNIAVLRQATMPSVLVELGFLSNKGDAQRLASENFRQLVAEALAEGVMKSLSKID